MYKNHREHKHFDFGTQPNTVVVPIGLTPGVMLSTLPAWGRRAILCGPSDSRDGDA